MIPQILRWKKQNFIYLSLYTAFQGENLLDNNKYIGSYVSKLIKLLTYIIDIYKRYSALKKITCVAGKHTTVIIYPCTWASVRCQVVPEQTATRMPVVMSCEPYYEDRNGWSNLRMEDRLKSKLSLYSSSVGGDGRESVRSGVENSWH